MKIALIGYGKMGRAIEEIVSGSKSHQIVSVSYKNKERQLDIQGIKKADVVIDFTSPEVILSNIISVIEIDKPMVVGTTGWYDKLDEVEKLVLKNGGSLIYGQNFSIGANLFFAIVDYSSKLVSKYQDYDVFGFETHHAGKKDSPSGTARKLSEIIIRNSPRKKTAHFEKLDRQIEDHELHFASIRGGRNFGMHEIVFDSPADEIRLTHQAWGRRGFALGAIQAGEFIKNKKGFYNFGEIFGNQIKKGGDKK